MVIEITGNDLVMIFIILWIKESKQSQPMNEPIAIYQSYLVRLWQDSPHALWRASAQCVQTREILHFADLDTLFTFLWAQTASAHQDQIVDSGPVGQWDSHYLTDSLTY